MTRLGPTWLHLDAMSTAGFDGIRPMSFEAKMNIEFVGSPRALPAELRKRFERYNLT
jgi:hypothetical protein